MQQLEEMLKELEELNARGYKLDDYCSSGKFEELSAHEQVLLCLQAKYMELYSEVLEARISLYEETRVNG